MRKVCAKPGWAGGLDTVPEVPVPEVHDEQPLDCGGRRRRLSRTVKAWVRSHFGLLHRRGGAPPSPADVQLMLRVIGAPLVPQRVELWKSMAGHDMSEVPLEVSKAKYVVEQYVAAAGGGPALSAAASMCAVGKVLMRTSKPHKKASKVGTLRGEVAAGGFVLWQKRPSLWCIEVVVSGSGGAKMCAGSDGGVAWSQAPWRPARAAPGPPRPLRRCVQGLDPKSTADLFSRAAWAGEKRVDGDDCFVLRVDAAPSALRARSTAGVEVVRHAVWGYFSQRTGLLVRLDDTHLLRAESAYWETSMESSVGDYRRIDGISVAHAGRTVASLTRFGGGKDGAGACGERTCTRMEETWSIEEVGFNVSGLSNECFLPPRDMVACAAPVQTHDCVIDRSSKRDNAAVSSKNAVGTWDLVPLLEVQVSSEDPVKVKGEINHGVVRRAPAAKVLVQHAATGLGWFGLAKVAAVGIKCRRVTRRSARRDRSCGASLGLFSHSV